VSFGAVFPTISKTDATPIGLPRLAKVRQMFPEANICAIGGIAPKSLSAVKAAGADCAAVISALFGENDIESMARNMVETWEKA
jgi:thiamine-phosphate pyrophosphorylase